MTRLLYLLPLLLFSCILAAIYGALHNQISYSVSPGYFHEFKFIQFQIDPSLQNRGGAMAVGALASWWMGVILGVPIYLTALFVKGDDVFWRTYMKASVLVVTTALAMGLGALLMATLTIDAANLPWWMEGRNVSDPVAFARAGTMHNFSYLGGLVGAFIGLAFTIFSAWQSHRDAAR